MVFSAWLFLTITINYYKNNNRNGGYMKILRIPDIGGIFNEMFDPEERLNDDPPKIINSRLDGSSFFWASLFEKGRISGVVDELEMNIDREEYDIVQYRSIIADKRLFINKCISAPYRICNDANSPKEFYSALETMTILCKLYSDFEYYPFTISIQEGFVLDQSSSKKIYDSCLNKRLNPYLNFVKERIIPVLSEYKPDILILQGQMSYYLAAISLLAKAVNPNIHICLTDHSSEYFSYNKITSLLAQNDYLFRIIDSLILDYFDYTEAALIIALNNGQKLDTVPNLIFSDGTSICQSHFCVPDLTDNIRVYKRMEDSTNVSNKTYDVHFEPYVKCHWNKCAFCGINKKYKHESIESSIESLDQKIKKTIELSKECDYLWFIDEAFSPRKLSYIATQLVNSHERIIWQARCRASKELLENGLPELLAESGLVELRIGLESASYFILKLMNKFEDDFSLEIMEEIVARYNNIGISIHCPMIIGFPQETSVERQRTFEFLRHLSEQYPLFTFNINILNVDISSQLYKEWGKYQIEQLSFPCLPKHFLGNSMEWISKQYLQELSVQGNSIMSELMFPWLPAQSMISPTVFYRLCETSRNTLRWKHLRKWNINALFSVDMILQISDELAFSKDIQNKNIIYDWNSHHFLFGNQYILEIIHIFDNPIKVSTAIKQLINRDPDIYTSKELVSIILQLYNKGFLCGNYDKHDIVDTRSLIKEYNRIYEDGDLIYRIETDALLLEYESYFQGGEALELGVGLGKNIDYLIEKNYHITGVDLSEVAISKLNSRYNTTDNRFIVDDIRDFYIDRNHYSLIICSMVLSYLSNEEICELAISIMNGLAPGGLLYVVDLSERDPLNSIAPENTTDHRTFFTCEKLVCLFPDLNIIELSDVLKTNDNRIGCNNSFGLIKLLGNK